MSSTSFQPWARSAKVVGKQVKYIGNKQMNSHNQPPPEYLPPLSHLRTISLLEYLPPANVLICIIHLVPIMYVHTILKKKKSYEVFNTTLKCEKRNTTGNKVCCFTLSFQIPFLNLTLSRIMRRRSCMSFVRCLGPNIVSMFVPPCPTWSCL